MFPSLEVDVPNDPPLSLAVFEYQSLYWMVAESAPSP